MNDKLFLQMLIDTMLIFTIIQGSRTVSASIINKKRLNKVCKYNGYVIKECPFIDNETTSNRKKQLDEIKLKEVLPLVQELANYTSEENLKTAYRNLLTLKVTNPKNKLNFKGYGGTYSAKENEIQYASTKYLGHEFLHLASSYYDYKTDEIYGGFNQIKKDYNFGVGLNEGYTELLASRIYNENHNVQSYKQLVHIAKLLELFFDNPKDMEKLYFNNNLLGFVKYMNKYAPTKEIIELLLEMDSIHTHLALNQLNPYILYKSLRIQLKLYKWFIANIKDKDKIKQFENIMGENKLINLLLNNKKIEIYEDNLYIDKNLNNEEISVKETESITILKKKEDRYKYFK